MIGFGLATLEKYIEDRIADYGASVIMDVVSASPVGAAFAAMSRFNEFVDTGGRSEIDAFRSGVFKAPHFKFQGMDLLQKMQASVQSPARIPYWQRRAPWASSRQQWRDEAWMHDWRSQPRRPAGSSIGGEWMSGRLSYPVAGATAVGKGVSRSSRQTRRMNRYRRYGRKAARDVFNAN